VSPRLPTARVFLVVALVVVGLAGPLALLARAQDGVIPLEYYPAGYLKPGYEVTVRLHAFGMTAVPLPVSHAFADAGVEFQGHKYGITGDDGGGPTGHVYYIIDNQVFEVDTYHYGKHEYDAGVKITAYCPGDKPSGAPGPAGPGEFWVKVEFTGAYGSYTRWDKLSLGGYENTGVPLLYFYEKTPGLQSWVSTENTVQFSKCGDDIIGSTPGGDTRNDNSGDDSHGPSRTTWFLLGAVVALFALLLLRPRPAAPIPV
jgi:hypothetical protein